MKIFSLNTTITVFFASGLALAQLGERDSMKLPPKKEVPTELMKMQHVPMYEGEPLDLNKDIREQCRAEIAGIYMNALNGEQTATAHAKILKQRLQKLKVGVGQYRQKLQRLEAKVSRPNVGFDLESERQLGVLRDRLHILEKRYDEDQRLLVQHEQTAHESVERQARLLKEIKKVFKVRRVKITTGFETRIDYHNPCPPFTLLCPLPVSKRKPLGQLLGAETPVACRRYSQVTGLQ